MKDKLIEKEERERICPECGNAVWMNWDESPNFHCTKCNYKTDMTECPICGGIMEKDSDLGVCNSCWEQKMEEQ